MGRRTQGYVSVENPPSEIGRPHRIVSNCDTLIELACSRLEPELVSACVTGAVDNALMRDRVNWTSLRNRIDVVVALVHAEESGLPSAIKQAFADGLDSLVERFAAVSLRWGLVTEPMLLVYNSILSHLSPDHVRRATELVLDVDRTKPAYTPRRARIRPGMVFSRPHGDGAHDPTFSLRGSRAGATRWPVYRTAQPSAVSAVVICACMEDLRARGPTPLLGNRLLRVVLRAPVRAVR